ncbi:sensor histidine kinase KdpD [Pedobacter sp. BMA]|uniref:sensor histidine kinase n=1 Tax=Pedobacter sp. BMA TaxID=1663685 RepID=UPI00069F91B3|nr:HAMP domain-containing sensor histidine kinase [Pedobacter sp. BMA]
MSNTSAILAAVQKNDPVICVVFNDADGNILYRNPGFIQFFDKMAQSKAIREISALIHQDDYTYVKQSYERNKTGEQQSYIEFRLVFEHQIFFLRMNLRFDDIDGTSVAIAYLEDRSVEKKHIDYLQEFANKKNAALSILSHDLAGPLGVIQMMSDMLISHKDLESNLQIEKMLNLISRSSKKGIAMIQDLIKKEFLESIGVEMVRSRVNLVDRMNQLFEEYKSGEQMLNIDFTFEVESDEIYAEVDESKFIQVINNLVSNSLKFTPDGGRITVRITENEQILTISVSDTGIGIPKQFHADLFKKFNPAGRSGLKGEPSVGLGMSTIKTILDWHQAEIWFESEEGKGTTFYISLAHTE